MIAGRLITTRKHDRGYWRGSRTAQQTAAKHQARKRFGYCGQRKVDDEQAPKANGIHKNPRRGHFAFEGNCNGGQESRDAAPAGERSVLTSRRQMSAQPPARTCPWPDSVSLTSP